MGGPALKPRMHRSNALRSSHESAGCSPRYSRRASVRSRPAGDISGRRPFGGIHDQRGAPGADGARSAVEPEVVVEARSPLLAPVHALGDRRAPGGPGGELVVPVDHFLLEVGGLLLGEERLVAQRLGPFQRRDGAKVPDALQVGSPPRGPRGVLGRDRRRRQPDRHRHRRRAHGYENSMRHLKLLLYGAERPHITSRSLRRGTADSWPGGLGGNRSREATVSGPGACPVEVRASETSNATVRSRQGLAPQKFRASETSNATVRSRQGLAPQKFRASETSNATVRSRGRAAR